MESLALLCTLHADGPATLKRLRRAGCDSLESIEAYGAADLATLLEVPPAVARRLLKEARGLGVRLDDGVLDDAEEAPQACAGSASSPALGAASGSVLGSTPTPQVTTQGFLDQRDYAILGRVLEHWSDEAEAETVDDRVESPPAEAEAPSEVNPDVESTRLWPEDPGTASCAIDEEQAAGAECIADVQSCAPSLCAGDFDGLDEAMITTLVGSGIESLSDVVAADPLALAEILGVTYANARRTQYLARAAEPKAEVMDAPVDEAVDAPVDAPVDESVDEPMDEPVDEPPTSIETSDPESDPSSVSLSFDARWRGVAPSTSEEDSAAPPRKFWEPQPSAALVTPDPVNEELVIEMQGLEVDAVDTSFDEVSTPEEHVSEEWSGEDAKPEATPEPASAPSEDLGPKHVSPPEPSMPEAATYGTPWPQDSGPELSRPLHVRFPSEPPMAEAASAGDIPTEERGPDRPLNWDFDLSGPSVRFPDNAPDDPLSGALGASAPEDPAIDPGSEGVGGPFA